MQSIYVGVAVALGVLLKSKPDNKHTLYHHYLTHRVSVLSPAGSLKESETWREEAVCHFFDLLFSPHHQVMNRLKAALDREMHVQRLLPILLEGSTGSAAAFSVSLTCLAAQL